MKSKVLCVYNEGSIVNTSLIGAKGFSVLVEVDGQRTLFDTGMRGAYLMHNMDYLDIDPESIDRVVISHKHKAHIGGLNKFLIAREKTVKVICDQSISEAKDFIGRRRITEEAVGKADFEDIGGWNQLSEHLFSTGSVGDSEESSLVIMTDIGPVVVCACCHAGVGQVLGLVRSKTGKNPIAVVGGLHIAKIKQPDADEIARCLKDEFGNPKLYLNHCTGMDGATCLRVSLGLEGVKEFYVGNELLF